MPAGQSGSVCITKWSEPGGESRFRKWAVRLGFSGCDRPFEPRSGRRLSKPEIAAYSSPCPRGYGRESDPGGVDLGFATGADGHDSGKSALVAWLAGSAFEVAWELPGSERGPLCSTQCGDAGAQEQ